METKSNTSHIRRNCAIVLFLSVLLNACISEYNAELPAEENDVLVFSGTIISDSLINFYLSKSFSLQETFIPSKSRDIQAILTITGSDGYQSEPAVYKGDGVHEIRIGKLNNHTEYSLKIEYDGETYLSSPAKPLITPEIDTILWSQPDKNSVDILVSTHSQAEDPLYLLWNYEEDWEITAKYKTYAFFDPDSGIFYMDASSPTYYCWKNNRTNSIMIGTTESLIENRLIEKKIYQYNSSDDRFSELYCTTLKQRIMSKNMYEFYLNRMKLNEGMGGLFTPQPTEMIGNITCSTNPAKKVIGFVDVVSNVTSKRLFIEGSKIQKNGANTNNCTEFGLDDDIMQQFSRTQLYSLGYRPFYYQFDPLLPHEEQWTNAYCADCSYSGSKKRPDFWTNDHY
jgi:hypothetical protein